mmetsp:Transcript_99146/g.318103  ORF Transcript_99146/g.318103 Transcript_99146/m.318103 type:complete len:263 (-) Transcript_99146:3275-4063(-)
MAVASAAETSNLSHNSCIWSWSSFLTLRNHSKIVRLLSTSPKRRAMAPRRVESAALLQRCWRASETSGPARTAPVASLQAPSARSTQRCSISPSRTSSRRLSAFISPATTCSSKASARAPCRTRSACASSRRWTVSSRRAASCLRSAFDASEASNLASNSAILASQVSLELSSSDWRRLARPRNSSASRRCHVAWAVAAPWASWRRLASTRAACTFFRSAARAAASSSASELRCAPSAASAPEATAAAWSSSSRARFRISTS